MNEAVQNAVSEIQKNFSEKTIILEEDGSGGAYVIVEDIDIGNLYQPETSWVGFRITFQYPYADVYPHFIRNDLVRKDNRPLGDGISGGHNFMGRLAIQLSRKSNRLNPLTDTAYLKLMKVIAWLKIHP